MAVRMDMAGLAGRVAARGAALGPPLTRALRRVPARVWAGLTESALVVLLAAIVVQIAWLCLVPAPLDPPSRAVRKAPTERVTRLAAQLDFDPFNRAASTAALQPVSAVTRETTLDLKLYGVRALEDAAQGSAIIRLPSHDQRAFWVGDAVLEGVTLSAVFADRVVLERGGTLETLSLGERKDGDKAAPTPTRPSSGAPRTIAKARPRTAAASQAAPRPKAQRVAATRPAPPVRNNQGVTRRALKRQVMKDGDAPVVSLPYKNAEALLDNLTLRPRVGDSGFNGLYIQDRGAGTVMKEAGLETGDVLVAVNGIRITSPKRLEKVRDRLEDDEPLTLIVERKGRETILGILLEVAS